MVILWLLYGYMIAFWLFSYGYTIAIWWLFNGYMIASTEVVVCSTQIDLGAVGGGSHRSVVQKSYVCSTQIDFGAVEGAVVAL